MGNENEGKCRGWRVMIKVLIADDEKNICLMIQKMIHWEDYGMEVIGIVHNGVDAMQMIEAQRPQLVISDIRMPGYDGLQLVKGTRDLNLETDFIIISGYKQFEYAHTAINLGVENYLLKPIDQEELQKVLEKIAKKHKVTLEKAKAEESLKAQAYSNRKKYRQHFLSDILEKNDSLRELKRDDDVSIAENSDTQYGFEQGCFCAFFLKIDFEERHQDISGFLRMTDELIEQMMNDAHMDYINSSVNSGIITIMNYKPEAHQYVEELLEKVFQRVMQEIEKFRGYHISIGVGTEKNNISETAQSIQEAIQAIKCRDKAGTDRIIYYSQLRYQMLPVQTYIEETTVEMQRMITALDYDAFRGRVVYYLDRIMATPYVSPVCYYTYLEEVINILISTFRDNQVEESFVLDLKRQMYDDMDYYIHLEEMGYRILEDIRSAFIKLSEQQKNKSHHLIRSAQRYIQEHYMQQISLEEVAEAIGLSSAYLSTMFKKELGINFSDCLISCRIEAAKELLKNSDASINEIAEQVGYVDAKYFSKTFSKLVGLKPSVYRKMYQ